MKILHLQLQHIFILAKDSRTFHLYLSFCKFITVNNATWNGLKNYVYALTEADFSHYLYTDGIPDPELIIRPSGELRLSNFLLWQCAYSEFYFCDTLWPDFTRAELDKAIIAYQKRDRRFGGVK